MDQHMPELPLIDRIKIAAELVVPIIKQMEEELGVEKAQAIVRRGASNQFRSMAREAVDAADGNGGQALLALNAGVRQGVGIMTDVRATSEGFDMDVKACVYARFFQELGEPELGFLLLCSADFDHVEEMGDVELSRRQTIMEGADHCDFQYRFLSQ
jgi:hypothetical protein